MRALHAALACVAVASMVLPALAQDDDSTPDEFLGEGWRLYSEELEFESAAEAFSEAADHPAATEAQQLEALEYLAACRWALEDQDGAREAIRRLLLIDRQGTLHDESHPPDLLLIVEQVRGELALDEPEEPEDPVVTDGPVEPFGGDGGGPVGDPGPSLEDHYPDEPARPWYTTWWFWTIAAAVVAAGVTTAIVVTLPAGEGDPPAGSLDPGVVQLPCTGLRF